MAIAVTAAESGEAVWEWIVAKSLEYTTCVICLNGLESKFCSKIIIGMKITMVQLLHNYSLKVTFDEADNLANNFYLSN